MNKTFIEDWTPGPGSQLRNIGYDLAVPGSTSNLVKSTRAFAWIFGLLWVLSGLVFFLNQRNSSGWLGIAPDLANSLLIQLSGAGVVFVLPIVSFLSYLQRKKKYFDFDIVFSLSLATAFAALFALEKMSPERAFWLISLGVSLGLIRYLESKIWRHLEGLESPHWSLEKFIHSLNHFSRKKLLRGQLIGGCLFSLLSILLFLDYHAAEDFLVILPAFLGFFLPPSVWLRSRLVAWLIKTQSRLNDIQTLFRLSREKFFRSHYWGTFRKPKIEKVEFLQDPTSAWEERELFELLKSLSDHSIHPCSQALSLQLASYSSLRLATENLDHIGLTCSFRCPQGLLHPTFLSHYHWLKAHDHEFSVEMERWYQEALAEQRLVSFLSIDKRIVLGISLETSAIENLNVHLRDLRSHGYRLGLWSSATPSRFHDIAKDLDDFAEGLIPIERETQRLHWNERSKSAVSILSYWDPPEESPIRVIFQNEARIDILEDEIHFHNQTLGALVKIIAETHRFHRGMRGALYIPVIWMLITFSISFYLGFEWAMLTCLMIFLVLVILFGPRLKKETI
jgi:hypothetical protein